MITKDLRILSLVSLPQEPPLHCSSSLLQVHLHNLQPEISSSVDRNQTKRPNMKQTKTAESEPFKKEGLITVFVSLKLKSENFSYLQNSPKITSQARHCLFSTAIFEDSPWLHDYRGPKAQCSGDFHSFNELTTTVREWLWSLHRTSWYFK